MLKLIRFWVPVVLCIAGIAVGIAGGFDEPSLQIAIPVFSAGASIWLLNFLYRVGVKGDAERDSETDAREYFREHGEWPADDAGAPPARSGQTTTGPRA